MSSRVFNVIASAALAVMVVFPASAEQKMITVKGSDTLVNLSATWAEAFMKKNPDIAISVTGGGSGVGLAALLNGTTDICNASRDIKQKEKDKAAELGIEPVELDVALDGIALVVNPANPIDKISLEQLRRIFTGEATSWKEVGGLDEKIIVLSRETSSGTYAFFQEHVLDKQDYTPNALMMPATSAIIEAVASDKTAIGYVGLGYAANAGDRVKVLPVKMDAQSPAVEANEETVRSGKYPIARALHCYTNGNPTGNIKKFLDFCLSKKGQDIVRKEGFVPITQEEKKDK